VSELALAPSWLSLLVADCCAELPERQKPPATVLLLSCQCKWCLRERMAEAWPSATECLFVSFVANCVTLYLILVVYIEELTLVTKVMQNVAN
jgi:hypothetical protein